MLYIRHCWSKTEVKTTAFAKFSKSGLVKHNYNDIFDKSDTVPVRCDRINRKAVKLNLFKKILSSKIKL